jgi:hypothetical protein
MSVTFYSPFSGALRKKKRHMVILCKMVLQHTLPLILYLWGNLKDKVCSNNPHTLDGRKQSIRETISSIEVSELELVSNNMFKRLEACLRAEGRHFEHLL